ncbi:cytochrome P450 monooxygenase-like protein [Microthyrium microscopicum]|uniref:Cytochrome P450 monooxygenase-like protein n=1 Tax=Microthyrium microscopicum TaxID=703497 RepID=A0A6A6TX77_9PEZI|nr:cytochrome P450 monooxygenase-like protein [Microthyrium microscopicum]
MTEQTTSSVLLLAIGIFFIALFKIIIYPALFSPLSSIPVAHPLARYTSLWILWTRYSDRESQRIHASHQRLGPVVLLGPNEVSVNCVDGGIRTIYGAGFEKHEYYKAFTYFDGIDNMFSTLDKKTHAARRRLVSKVYSKSHVENSASLASSTETILLDRFMVILTKFAANRESVDIFALLGAVTTDLLTSYQFGLRSGDDLLTNAERWNEFLDLYLRRDSCMFWKQELPELTRIFGELGFHVISPRKIEGHEEIEWWLLQRLRGVENGMSQLPSQVSSIPEVYSQMSSALHRIKASHSIATDSKELEREIASEMIDHLIAGFELTSIALLYYIYELSRHPHIQRLLRHELCGLRLINGIPCPKALDAAPLLTATVQETLRLHPSLPGPQPRRSPPKGCTLGPPGSPYEWHIPGGVRVSAQPHSLHRNAEIFESPDEWLPDRWLREAADEELRAMNRWFWAFSSGSRMCVGKHLALYIMKSVIWSIYAHFTTEITDHSGMLDTSLYIPPPRQNMLLVKLVAVPHEAESVEQASA